MALHYISAAFGNWVVTTIDIHAADLHALKYFIRDNPMAWISA